MLCLIRTYLTGQPPGALGFLHPLRKISTNLQLPRHGGSGSGYDKNLNLLLQIGLLLGHGPSQEGVSQRAQEGIGSRPIHQVESQRNFKHPIGKLICSSRKGTKTKR